MGSATASIGPLKQPARLNHGNGHKSPVSAQVGPSRGAGSMLSLLIRDWLRHDAAFFVDCIGECLFLRVWGFGAGNEEVMLAAVE